MKKYRVEIFALCMQVVLLFASSVLFSGDQYRYVAGMGTFFLSCLLGLFSKYVIKLLYPFAVGMLVVMTALFIPSASLHEVWMYMLAACLGMYGGIYFSGGFLKYEWF